MSSKSRTLLLAFAAVGLGASAMSSYVHYQLLTDASYTSFCDVSETVSCTQAYLSQYGSFWGVPVAILGVIFFTVVLLMAGLARPPKRAVLPGKKSRAVEETGVSAENVPGYIFALSTIGLAFVLYLAWASFFQLQAICLLCAITYVAVVAIFIVSGGASSVPMTTLPRRAMRDASVLAKSPSALVITLLLVGGAVTAIAAFPRDAGSTPEQEAAPVFAPLTDGQREQFEKWYDVQPVVPIPVDRGSAKVLVVKFNDYQCPPCRQTHNEYKGIIAQYSATGDLKYVLKHFPLEAECNPAAPGSHSAACEAAAAVIMAKPKGTAEKLEAWLFANQGPPQLVPQQVRDAAREVAGITDFDAQYATVLNEVRADAALGAQLGAKSTPTFFINGRRIAGGLPPAAFQAAIELELKRSR